MKRFIVPLLTAVMVVSIIFAGCMPGAPAPPVTPPPVTPPPVTPPEEKVLKFAQLQPLSGPAAAYGTYSRIGYNFAEEDINAAGGIKVGDEYYRVEIIEYDTKWDPTVADTVARMAIYEEGVKFMSVHADGEQLMAFLPIVERENVLLFALTPDAGYLGPEHPSIFYNFIYPPDCLTLQYEYIANNYPEVRRVVGTFPDTSGGYDLAEVWEEGIPEFGFEIVDTIFVPLDTVDFYPMFTPLLPMDVDMIEQAGFPGELSGLMMKQGRELGWEGLFAEYTGGEFESRASAVGWEVLEGMLGTGYPAVTVTEFGEEFYERCEGVVDDPPVWIGFFYDQLFLLKLAIEKADSIEPAEVMQALEEVTFSGVLGEDLHFAGEEMIGINRLLAFTYVVTEIVDGEPASAYESMPRWAR